MKIVLVLLAACLCNHVNSKHISDRPTTHALQQAPLKEKILVLQGPATVIGSNLSNGDQQAVLDIIDQVYQSTSDSQNQATNIQQQLNSYFRASTNVVISPRGIAISGYSFIQARKNYDYVYAW